MQLTVSPPRWRKLAARPLALMLALIWATPSGIAYAAAKTPAHQRQASKKAAPAKSAKATKKQALANKTRKAGKHSRKLGHGPRKAKLAKQTSPVLLQGRRNHPKPAATQLPTTSGATEFANSPLPRPAKQACLRDGRVFFLASCEDVTAGRAAPSYAANTHD